METEERELWRSYCKLLCEELVETTAIALTRGWWKPPPGRAERGVTLRAALRIDPHCNDLPGRDCPEDCECEECLLAIEGFCPEDCEECSHGEEE